MPDDVGVMIYLTNAAESVLFIKVSPITAAEPELYPVAEPRISEEVQVYVVPDKLEAIV